MPVIKVIDRQFAQVALSPICGIAQIGAGNEVTFAVRPGTLVLRAFVQTTVAFDGTTNTASLGDGTTVFASAVDVKTAGAETVTNAPKYYPTGGTITLSMAQTGVATVGQLFAGFEYLLLGNGNAGVQE